MSSKRNVRLEVSCSIIYTCLIVGEIKCLNFMNEKIVWRYEKFEKFNLKTNTYILHTANTFETSSTPYKAKNNSKQLMLVA